MLKGKKVIVVMPAYNAAQTLRMTYDEVMEQDIVDLVILVDDGSLDETVSIAKTLPDTVVYTHESNRGYGGNQKSCYRLALEEGGDCVVQPKERAFVLLSFFQLCTSTVRADTNSFLFCLCLCNMPFLDARAKLPTFCPGGHDCLS